MAKQRNRRERRERRGGRRPTTTISLSESQLAELEGRRVNSAGEAAFPADRVDDLGATSDTDSYEYELESEVNADLLDEPESLELLTERELLSGETDDAIEASEEGLTYVPPTDPPANLEDREDALDSDFGVSVLDEPYDQGPQSRSLLADNELVAQVREALLENSSTNLYADQVQISESGGRVVLRGTVDDLIDADNLLAVAGYVNGVTEVVDELVVRALERGSS